MEQLDFCAAHGVGVVQFSEPRLLGSLEPRVLAALRTHADMLGIQLEVGMLSICPSATIFNAAAGTAEQQLAKIIDAAVVLGSPLVRCVVGSFRDRVLPGGIERRITDALEVLGNIRSRAEDAHVRIAVENHAGDMQARELKILVEEAGPDLVGVCLDAGNALWAMEDPRSSLQVLAPYVLTSHTRDTVVRRTDDGAEVAWTRMGEGNIGIAAYLDDFQRLCPSLPIMLEIIVMPEPRRLPFREASFWDGYPAMPAREFLRFLDLVDGAAPAAAPRGAVSPTEELANVVASIRWAAEYLNRGR